MIHWNVVREIIFRADSRMEALLFSVSSFDQWVLVIQDSRLEANLGRGCNKTMFIR